MTAAHQLAEAQEPLLERARRFVAGVGIERELRVALQHDAAAIGEHELRMGVGARHDRVAGEQRHGLPSGDRSKILSRTANADAPC